MSLRAPKGPGPPGNYPGYHPFSTVLHARSFWICGTTLAFLPHFYYICLIRAMSKSLSFFSKAKVLWNISMIHFSFHFKIIYPGYKSVKILFCNWPYEKKATYKIKKLYTTKFIIKVKDAYDYFSLSLDLKVLIERAIFVSKSRLFQRPASRYAGYKSRLGPLSKPLVSGAL